MISRGWTCGRGASLRLFAVLSLALGMACGGSPAPANDPPAAKFSLVGSVSPSPLSLTQGVPADLDAALSVRRDPSFHGTISFQVSGLPAGVTETYGVAWPSDTIGHLSFHADGTQLAGTYQLTLLASSPGVGDQSLSFTMQVAPPVPSVAVESMASLLLIHPGDEGTVQIGITRSGGYAGAVDLAAEGLPAGVLAAFAPASTEGISSTLTLNVDPSTAPGTYALTISGKGVGTAEATTVLGLLVDGQGSTLMSLRVEASPIPPSSVGFQDGDGPWQDAPQDSDGTFRFVLTDPAGRYGVAAAWPGSLLVTPVPSGRVLKATVAEVPAPDIASPQLVVNGAVQTSSQVTGTLAGLGDKGTAQVSVGRWSTKVTVDAPSFDLQVDDGTLDLAVARTPSGASVPDRLLLSRGAVMMNGDPVSVGTLDLDQGLVLAPVTLDLDPAEAGEVLHGEVRFITAGSASGERSKARVSLGFGSTTTFTFGSVPAGVLQSGDLFVEDVRAALQDGTGLRRAVSVTEEAPASPLALPPGMDLPVLSSSSVNGAALPVARWSLDAGTRWTDLVYRQSNRGVCWEEAVTSGWSSQSADGADHLPDLSGLTGWMPGASLASSQPIDWTVTRIQTPNLQVPLVLDPTPAAGISYTAASRSGTLQP
ncbi:MAG TPA: hypothetical protein VFT46_06145 [Holophagaceae bacterium]|nr:hypothetical protein [Holophagaceae bacterium]